MKNGMRGSALIFYQEEQHVSGHTNISNIKIRERNYHGRYIRYKRLYA